VASFRRRRRRGGLLRPLALHPIDLLVQLLDGLLHAADGFLELPQLRILVAAGDPTAETEHDHRGAHHRP
jgi:hypothetical protein